MIVLSSFYQKEFNRSAVTIMTGTNYTIALVPRVSETVQAIRYFGKINLNRYKSIADVGRTLDQINIENNTSYTLEIYCNSAAPEAVAELSSIKSIKICDFISGEEFKKKFFSSDILLHIEAFDDASIDRTKHSVSTKIADSLASGIPLLAYGPSFVASIKHLLNNKCAIIITDSRDLKSKILQMLNDKTLRQTAAQNGLITARTYHDSSNNSALLYRLLLTRSQNK